MEKPKNLIEKYGLGWDADKFAHPAQIDLALYANDSLRGKASKALSKADHLREAIRASFPEHVFSFDRWSNGIIDEWCEEDIVTIWGSSSSGKSGTVGMVLLFDLLAAPTVTKVSLCTSPLKMHDDRCFGSIKKWHAHLPPQLRVGKVAKAPAPALLTVDRDGQTAGIVCISTKEGESTEDLKSKIGAHQKRNRFAVDEPQKCSESILSVRANFGASGEYKEIFFGNPDSWFSPLGKHSLPDSLTDGTRTDTEKIEKEEPDKWRTRNTWRGKHGVCIVLDGRKSPALENPGLTHLASKEHLDDLVANFGEDSMQLWTYGIGRMPPSGAVSTLISTQDLRSSGSLAPPEDVARGWRDIAGLDPSGGRDGVRLARARVGTSRSGHVLFQILNVHPISVKVSDGDVSGQIAAQTAAKLREWAIPVTDFACDATGNQGAQVDRIEQELGQRGVLRVMFSGPPSKRPVSRSGSHTAADHYADRSSELLSNFASLCKQGRAQGVTDAVAHQVSTRKTHHHKGRLKAEEKRDWKERNQGKSSDDMDAVVVALELAIHRRLIRPFLDIEAPAQQSVEQSFFEQRTRRPGYLDRFRRAARVARRR